MEASHRAYALLTLLFLLSFGYWIGGAGSLYDNLRFGPQRARQPFDFGIRPAQIDNAEREALDAGGGPGDVLVEFNGRPFSSYAVMRDALRHARPGSSLPVRVRHPNGTTATVSIRLVAERPGPAPLSEWLRDISIQLAFPLFCLVLGFWVAAARPLDRNAWLLLAIMISLEFMVPDGSFREPWQVLSVTWSRLAGFSWPIWMMLFGIYFPERSAVDRRWPWIKWLVVLIVTATGLPLLVVRAGKEISLAAIARLEPVLSPLDLANRITAMAAISLFFANMGAKSATASTKDAARRIRFVWLGSAVGLTPGFVVALVSLFRGGNFGDGFPAGVQYLTLGCMALFPLTLAYVILVQRAMDVRVAIRQSARYTMVRGVLWLIGALMFSLAMKIFVDVSQNKRGITLDQTVLLAGGAGLLVMRRRYRGRAQQWVDRRFFREDYRAEQVLSDLSNEARRFVDAGPLLDTVTHRIAETLHVPHISVLLRDGTGYRLAAAGADPGAPVLLAPEAHSIAHLRAAHGPAVVYFDKPDAWLRDAPAPERQALHQLDAQLLLPLTGRDDMIGVMALGPKRSEEPYSKTDLQLLQSVADQTGLAIENGRLLSSLAEEAARRERYNRELEIAREVQERLFPQAYPSIPGLDCAGHCRPAQGVGGDYYDFIQLPDAAWGHLRTGEGGRLGIAVGDVSGKGISAALLMASLRASLRGQTLGGPTDLAALMRNVNALLYEASAANRYATFFYAQYDPSDRTLALVNAGHNPPIVLRGGDVLRLEADGPVVGLLPHAQYEQSSVALAPGDILLAYTDGISEAMTIDDEEWGEDRMIAAAQACRALPAAQMIERLMAAADAFTAGAPQHDDMTLVIVKVEA